MRTLGWLLLAAMISPAPVWADLPSPERGWTVAQPGKNWRMPQSQSIKWAARLRKLCPPGWTVSARGNSVIMQRERPVAFLSSAHLINAGPKPLSEEEEQQEREREKQRVVVRDRVYRLTIEFGPRLSQDQYEKLAAANEATRRADWALRRKHKVEGGKFNIISSYTPEQKAREQAYRAEAKKLVWHQMPDLYSTDLRASLFHSWNWLEHLDPKDEEAAAECSEVMQSLVNLFGVYDANAARGGSTVGREEGSGEKPGRK